jgi:hypothetical protein
MANYNKEKDPKFLEAHYTPQELIDEMFILLDKFYKGDITEFMENSAGDGRFLDIFKNMNIPYIAYDIDNPTNRTDIITKDYLKEKIDYKKGRVCLMNPPFAKGVRFLKKAINECDYVITILSSNSIMNLDYNTIWCDEIQLWRKYDFGSCKTDITIIACRKKRDDDKYEI